MLQIFASKQVVNDVVLIKDQAAFDNISFKDNTTYLLQRGQTFTGTLTVTANNVTIGSYGSGADPIITQAQAITGWTDELDGTYSKTQSPPKWLFQDGSVAKMAETDWIEILSISGDTVTISHSDVSAYSSIVGAIMMYKYRNWATRAYTITAYDGAGTITLDKDIGTTLNANSPNMKLMGKKDFLSAQDEWAYESGNIYIQSTSSPTNITEPINDNCVVIIGDNVKIKDLELHTFHKAGIIRKSGNNTAIENCNIHDGRGIAIQMSALENNFSAVGNTISDCGAGGIFIRVSKNHNIARNIVSNIGMQDNYGYNIDTGIDLENLNSAIQWTNESTGTFYSTNCICEYNTVHNVAQCGIKVAGKNNYIRYNTITDAMQRFVDGGGYYSWGGNDASPTTPTADNNTIEYNFISGCTGSHDGVNVSASTARGIHLDDRTNNSIVKSNVIWDCQQATLIKGEGHTIENNTFDSELENWEWITQASQTPSQINEGNIFNDNILVTRDNIYPPFLADVRASDPDYNPYAAGGEADNNYYINPYGTVIGNDTNGGDLTLSQLQALYSEDANSIEHTNYITAPGDPDNEILLITNPSDSEISGTAPAGTWKDVDGTVTTNYTVSAWSSLLLLKDLP